MTSDISTSSPAWLLNPWLLGHFDAIDLAMKGLQKNDDDPLISIQTIMEDNILYWENSLQLAICNSYVTSHQRVNNHEIVLRRSMYGRFTYKIGLLLS